MWYVNRGNARGMSENNYSGALEDFNKALDLNPSSAGAYGNRGIVKQQDG